MDLEQRRLQLQVLLEVLLGSRAVYFQEPPNTEMQYPCIVYKWDDVDTTYADNAPWRQTPRFQLTLIHEDPDNEIRGKIAELPLCSFDRFFVVDNLNHYVYNIFF